MIPMSSAVSWDWVSCHGGVWIVGGMRVVVRGGRGDFEGGGEGFLNETGRLGLGARQFGESERLGRLWGGSLCGGESLQSLEGRVWGSQDLQEVRTSLQSAGGTYRGGPLWFEPVGPRFRTGLVTVT
jgi:hypothetical protein